MAISSQRKNRLRLLSALLMLLFLLVSVEIVLQVYERASGWHRQDYFSIFRPNPHGTGSFYLKPGVDFSANIEGRPVQFATNAHGWAGPDHQRKKEPEKKRIAFLGDSFVMGLWTDSTQQNFVEVAGKELGPEYEVLNFGVGGYGLADVRKLLEEEVLAWDVDEVVVVFYAGNDFQDTGRGLMDSSAFVRNPSPGLWLTEHSATMRWLAGFWHRRETKKLQASSPFLTFPEPENAPERIRMLDWRYWNEDSAEYQNYRVAKDLGACNLWCADHGIPFYVVGLPYYEQVYLKDRRGENWKVGEPFRHLNSDPRAGGFFYLDLLERLRFAAATNPDELYFRKEGHLTPEGHQVVGEMIGGWIRQKMGVNGRIFPPIIKNRFGTTCIFSVDGYPKGKITGKDPAGTAEVTRTKPVQGL